MRSIKSMDDKLTWIPQILPRRLAELYFFKQKSQHCVVACPTIHHKADDRN